MKKRINLITIFIITLFFVSIIAVSTPLAKSQQRTPVPDSQQPPPTRPEGTQRAQLPKSEFWDLAIDHCIINGEFVDISPCDPNSESISVKVGQIVNFKCYYNIITIPVTNITKADAAYWGSGNLTYKNLSSVLIVNDPPEPKQEWRNLPHFTWADVTKWQTSIIQADVTKSQTSMKQSRKVWKDNMTFTWTPTQQNIGAAGFYFDVDHGNVIKEPVGPTSNNHCTVWINVTP